MASTRTDSVRYVHWPLITSRGLLLLSAGGLLPLVSLVLEFPAVYCLVGLLLFLGIFSMLLLLEAWHARSIARRLVLQLQLPQRLYSGVSAPYQLTLVTNHPTTAVSIRLRLVHPQESVASVREHQATLSMVAQELQASIKPLQRGSVVWTSVVLRTRGYLGLAEWQSTVPLAVPVARTVFPGGSIERQATRTSLVLSESGERIIDVVRRGGREFDSLRPYAAGDDIRQIDWKRSARGAGLLVRKFRPDTHQRLIVALDCSRRMSCRIGERLQIEYATDAAATLMQAAVAAGDDFGLFAFSHEPLLKIPPARGARHEQRVLQGLVDITVGTLEPDYQLLSDWAQMSQKRALLVLITTAANPSSLDGIKLALLPLRQKHLPLVFIVEDTEIASVAKIPANSLEDAYIIAAASSELAEVRRRAVQLQQMGVECVYCSVEQLSEHLRRKYIELKRRGAL